jgi:hypothetical protein
MPHLFKKLSVGVFKALDRLGLHVLPKHYYTPVADQAWLRQNKALWAKRMPMLGIQWHLEEQLAWLLNTCSPYYGEVAGLREYEEIVKSRVGPGYGPIESQVLHCVIRSLQPARIFEIGSGVSTATMVRAISKNEQTGGRSSNVTCIEPFPKAAFRSVKGVTHIEKVCQAVPASVYQELSSGDLLFIDSSHSLKTGSELATIYLQIIPSLPPGITIHIHDIFLPYVHSPAVLDGYFDWQETSLVLALLTNNPRLKILCSLAALQQDREAQMRSVLPDFKPRPMEDGLFCPADAAGQYVSSLWLQTC